MIARTIAAVAALAAVASAQTIDVTSADRSYSLIATGYDYDFDDGVGANDATAALSGAWEQDVAVDFDDWWGGDVSGARALHESDLWGDGIVATLRAEATSYGSWVHYNDAWSETELDATFDVARRVRYSFAVDMTTTDAGYAVATAILSRPGQTVEYAREWDGGNDAQYSTGWLAPGTYSMWARAEAAVIEGSNDPAEQSVTDLAFELRTFAAGDYQMDGDVDRSDRRAFRYDWLAHDPAADFDGDGDTDDADWAAFLAAWRQIVRH